jgi:hypothetical protein
MARRHVAPNRGLLERCCLHARGAGDVRDGEEEESLNVVYGWRRDAVGGCEVQQRSVQCAAARPCGCPCPWQPMAEVAVRARSHGAEEKQGLVGGRETKCCSLCERGNEARVRPSGGRKDHARGGRERERGGPSGGRERSRRMGEAEAGRLRLSSRSCGMRQPRKEGGLN